MASGSAKRYVQAVVELAREKGSFDTWQRDLAKLDSLVSDEEVRTYLENPSIQSSAKVRAVDAVLQDAEPEVRNLLHMLIERRKVDLIPEIVRRFDEAVLAERGIALVDVTTADALNDAGKDLVKRELSRLLGKDIELRLHTDPEIIGGFVARAGDQVIDASVLQQLRRLRTRLVAA
ncbi:MAG TPA: F0F1 ATP synthase subunit delta [Thermomicrobiales bacterium]|nr:F0F1 ATP synthase subunit delta [Thermomicrobiales bacterium]